MSMPLLTPDRMRWIAPRCPAPEVWCAALNAAMQRYGIETPDRVAAFVAQIAHESGEFSRLTEDLTYTTAERIRAVWPKRFQTLASAAPFVRNPEALANRVYANRLGNGDAASGDGWRYRGRGLIQLTGRANYADAARALGLPLLDAPQLLEQPDGAARCAAWFWQSYGLNALADEADFVAITQVINGGTVGLSERRRYWAQASAALGALPKLIF